MSQAASSTILEQLMTKPAMNSTMNSSVNSSKINLSNNMGGMMSSNPYMNFMTYPPTGMQGFPSMQNSNFNPAQFLPPG